MPIDLKGKQYYTVAERLVKFNEDFRKNFVIRTSVVSHDADRVVIKAEIIEKGGEYSYSTGHGEGFYGNGEKCLEKAETTAVGRALAFLHPDLMGTDIASADEIQEWMRHGQKKDARMPEGQAKVLADLLESADVGSGEGIHAFAEAWVELDEPEQRSFTPWFSTFWPGQVSAMKQKGRDVMWAWRQDRIAEEEA